MDIITVKLLIVPCDTGFMRIRIAPLAAAVLLLMAPYALSQEIATGYAESVALGELQTFQFLKQDRQSPDGLADDPETEEFIRNQLGGQLVAAGFRPVTENPDFYIAFYAKTYLRASHDVLGYKTLDSPLAIRRDEYDMGVLIVDFVSPDLKSAIWRGRADKAVNQKNAEKSVQKVSKKLVGQFQKDVKRQARQSKKKQ